MLKTFAFVGAIAVMAVGAAQASAPPAGASDALRPAAEAVEFVATVRKPTLPPRNPFGPKPRPEKTIAAEEAPIQLACVKTRKNDCIWNPKTGRPRVGT